MMICATISPLISGAFTSQYLPAIHVPHQHIQQQQVGLEGQMQLQRRYCARPRCIFMGGFV